MTNARRLHHDYALRRSGESWEQDEYRAGQHVELASPQLVFDVGELYAGIRLD